MRQAADADLFADAGDDLPPLALVLFFKLDGRDAIDVVEQNAVAADLRVMTFNAQEIGVELMTRPPVGSTGTRRNA
jgi:hypothetical protein